MKRKIFIWGAGGQGTIVLDILKTDKNFQVVGFLDSNKKLEGVRIHGFKVFGDKKCIKDLWKENIRSAIVAVGDNKERCKIADYLKRKKIFLINAIHPKAIINSNVSIGDNVTIASGAIICTDVIIENNVIINTGSIVEHQDIVRNGAHITPGVKLAGRVEIGEKAFVGIGSVVIQNLKVGDNSIIGAGAIVTKSIPSNVVAVGVPARVIKKIAT